MVGGFDDDLDDVLQKLKMMKENEILAYKYNRELDAQTAAWVGVTRNIDKYASERLTRLLHHPRGGHHFMSELGAIKYNIYSNMSQLYINPMREAKNDWNNRLLTEAFKALLSFLKQAEDMVISIHLLKLGHSDLQNYKKLDLIVDMQPGPGFWVNLITWVGIMWSASW